MRVLACGSRNWDDYALIRHVIENINENERIDLLIEGGANGADRLSCRAAEWIGISYWEFPANWAKHGRAAGPIRNRQMLEDGKPDLVLAFHKDLNSSKGTFDMVKLSLKAGVPVLVFDGEECYDPSTRFPFHKIKLTYPAPGLIFPLFP